MTPLEIVNEFISALEANDLDRACSMVTDDCEYDNVPMIKVFGPDGIKGILGPMFANCETIEWIIHRQAESGHVVFNERLDRFKMPFGWIELPVNGVWEVRDGKISLWRDYFDAASYVKQMPAQSQG